MKVSYKAYKLVRNKYMNKGKIVHNECCIVYSETLIEGTDGHEYSIYEEGSELEEDNTMYVSISKDGDIIEEYEVRI